MASRDRTKIARLMVPHFTTMADTRDRKFTSDEWHGFMNAMTGADVPLDEPNATAFDKWRQALAKAKNLPVWTYTPEKIAAIKTRGEELKAEEDARVSVLPLKLVELAKEAPTKSVTEMIRDALMGERK